MRDGADLAVAGYAFAPTFSIWTTIEECLNPPLIWERERGWYTTAPFSEPEVFEFPAGIGPVECVNVEHEEVVLIPRWVDCERVTFKYGLGDEFIGVLKTLNLLGLDSTEQLRVKGVEVAPRDVVAAALPDPAQLGDKMTRPHLRGHARHRDRQGRPPRAVYLHHIADNEETMARDGVQAVVWQTAINPVVAMELLASGVWQGVGRARAGGVRRGAVPGAAGGVRVAAWGGGARSVGIRCALRSERRALRRGTRGSRRFARGIVPNLRSWAGSRSGRGTMRACISLLRSSQRARVQRSRANTSRFAALGVRGCVSAAKCTRAPRGSTAA